MQTFSGDDGILIVRVACPVRGGRFWKMNVIIT